VFFMGVVPQSGSGLALRGSAFTDLACVVADQDVASLDLSGAHRMVAHEFGHCLSLYHAPGCNTLSTDPNWPTPSTRSFLREYGWDWDAAALWGVDPVIPAWQGTDIMGY